MVSRLSCISHCCGRGYNIGMRIIEEFLAKTAELPLWSKTPCADFREAMDVVAKVGRHHFFHRRSCDGRQSLG